ncbi:MAG: iron-sulfur cluster repair di-iron protein [Solirubrobacteraceae bacterium]
MALSAAAARRRRAPLVALAIVALFAGLWGGLIRLGLSLPDAVTSAAELHGPLMALGFLGTLVSLERAVALERPWAYVAPLAAAAGALSASAGAPDSFGAALLTLAGCVLLTAHLVLHRLQPSAHNGLMGLGALAWCVAAILWLTGADVSQFAPLMAGFLVLTIVGERLELTRAVNRSPRVRWLLIVAVVGFVVGLAVSVFAEPAGIRIAGVGLVGQAAWLVRYDLARRTVRMRGVTRFMAVALLAGYVWLACAGVLWTVYAPLADGPAYDASLHAVFLGFVMSMVFAHAPVIVPAVLRVPLPFQRSFYAHLALLHGSLALRLLGGDLAGSTVLWQWGGIAGEAAILLFLSSTAASVARALRAKTRPRTEVTPEMTTDTPPSPDTTLASLVAEHPARARLFELLRLDYCCGGGQTLAEACAQRGLDLHAVQAALRRVQDTATNDDVENTDWRRVSTAALCDHIVSVHHDGLRETFPRIAGLLSTVVRVHGEGEPRLAEVQRVFEAIRTELEPHLASEEDELFPACIAWEQQGTPVDEETIDEHEREHAAVGDALTVLRDLCHDYDRQTALCSTHRGLLEALEAFEQDLHRHVHEENNILLTRVRSLASDRRRAPSV